MKRRKVNRNMNMTTSTTTSTTDLRAEAAALAAEVHRSRPAPVVVTTPAPPPPAPRRLDHSAGCVDCGSTDFTVVFDQRGPGDGRVERRDYGGRCWSCTSARAEGADGLAKRAWKVLTGWAGVPPDLDRISLLLFSDHPTLEPTEEPWAWVDRDAYLDLACSIWSDPRNWPPEHRHRCPVPPAPTPEPQRPCRLCGSTGAEAYVASGDWYPTCSTCSTAERGGQEGICALAASVVGLTRRIGVVDLRQIAWRWWSDLLPDDATDSRPDPEGSPEPFGFVDLDAVRTHAIRRWPDASDWRPDAFRAAQRADASKAKAKR